MNEPTSAQPCEKKPFISKPVLSLAIIAILVAVIWIWIMDRPASEPDGSQEKGPTTLSFEGQSSELRNTVIVPTLNSPIPQGKSAIWSAGLPMVWNALGTLAGSPLDLPEHPALARTLTKEAARPTGLEAKDYYVAAGYSWKGIYQKLMTEVPPKFPKAPLPQEQDPAIVGYAYVEVMMKFAQAFLQEDAPFFYRDSSGRRTSVYAFGVRAKDKQKIGAFRTQVVPLFHDGQNHYAVDLSADMKPYQVIVACLDRDATLQELLGQLERRSKAGPHLAFGDESILTVPNMDWSVRHEFAELNGQRVQAKGWPAEGVLSTQQALRFRMDRHGVQLAIAMDVSSLVDGDEPHRQGHFIFDRPYLIVLKRREEKDPFFVMWNDNAELLHKK